MMKKIFPCLLLPVLFFIPVKSSATHAAGMDISFACYGNNLYQFYVTFYRDCIGIDAPPSMKLYLASDNCAYLDSFNMTLGFSTQGSDTISHLAGLCPDASSQCVGGTYTGYEQYIYFVNITVPEICDDWVASTYIEFRNNAITNLVNPGNKRLYVECQFSNANGLCDNSPLFSNVPLAYSCVNELFLYNHGAYDPDGDSLAYQLVNPLNGANDPINYVSLFLGPEYPLYTQDETFGFDSITGQMSCVPDAIQIVVISVLITEYRNGVKIGSTQRDLQVVIKTCDNNLPQIPEGIENVTGGLLIDSTTVQVCPGALLDFDLIASDADTGDAIKIITNLPLTIPGATYNISGDNPDTIHVQWQTSIADTGFYVFTVTLQDDACPIVGSQIYSYVIQIGTPMLDAGPDLRICETNPEIQLNVNGLSPFQWSNAQYLNDASLPNPTATLPGLGTYPFVVTADVGGFCQRNDTVLITVDPDFISAATISPDSVCAAQPVVLNASANGGVGDYVYAWSSFPPGFNSSLSSTVDSPLTSTVYTVLIVSGGCVHEETVEAHIHPQPDASFEMDSVVCIGELSTVTYTGNISGEVQFDWNFEEGNILSGNGEGPYQVEWNEEGSYLIELTVTNEFGCKDYSFEQIKVAPNPTALFTANTIGCEPLTVFFQNESIGGSAYLWQFGDGGVSTDINPVHTYSAGIYSVTLTVTSEFGCLASVTLPDFIEVLPAPVACAATEEDISHPYDLSQATFHFENCSQFGTSYTWNFGDGSLSTAENPEHTFAVEDTFFVTLLVSNGYCADSVTLGPIVIVVAEDLQFPTAFSPNGDGSNDFFHHLYSVGLLDLYYAVYNRWGELVFETTDPQSKGWDGLFKGKKCDVGVYVWKADAGFVNGARSKTSGNVTLIR
jgi:gliding motility-associated-like protein